MKTGIYKIQNLKNGRLYVGSAQDLNERRINHFSMLRNNSHTSIILQRAWNKTEDKSNFKFEILEYCEKDKLIERENYYLNLLCKSEDYIRGINKKFINLSYNILPLAKKGFSGTHRFETIEKLRMNHPLRKDILIYKNEGFITKVLSSKEAANFTKCATTSILKACKEKKFITKSGYIFCFEADKEIVERALGTFKIEVHNKGKKYTKKECHWVRSTPIRVTNLQTNDIQMFISQSEASLYFGLPPCTINRCLKKGNPYRKKLLFEYHNDIV